jgi:Histone RNA hairpin-binding protein RNA-binding domain
LAGDTIVAITGRGTTINSPNVFIMGTSGTNHGGGTGSGSGNPRLVGGNARSSMTVTSSTKTKPTVQKKGGNGGTTTYTKKIIRFHSVTCGGAQEDGGTTKNSHAAGNHDDGGGGGKHPLPLMYSAFHKLDGSDPDQARKMHQRRRAVEKGKNTVGYDQYCRLVPRGERRSRSMDTPATPDHTLDVPNKRWNGMVRAWYGNALYI